LSDALADTVTVPATDWSAIGCVIETVGAAESRGFGGAASALEIPPAMTMRVTSENHIFTIHLQCCQMEDTEALMVGLTPPIM
jgi:hypothetical protein